MTLDLLSERRFESVWKLEPVSGKQAVTATLSEYRSGFVSFEHDLRNKETVDTLSKDRAHVIHTGEPRFILCSVSGTVHSSIGWSESPSHHEQFAEYKHEAIRAFFEHNQGSTKSHAAIASGGRDASLATTE